ncbi:inactive leucine-rich repeat receptor-like protein kinase [Acorus calamus]|uniref:Inactive leucine-rich repeat receptor-like protein kinase n=1 Tax=Acorus calamus TaxID=4465 RepID=A0AAV9CCM2_ACOCL|nr:inactive leucine-rich repeat receptor-like protein kinase [Acorus calamus]
MGVAQVLERLHWRRNGFYGCVSSENVYLDERGEPRLRVDLPGAVGFGGKGGGGDGGYLPPEIKDNKDYTEKSDVYAFGVLMIELVTGRHSDDVEDHHPHHNRQPGDRIDPTLEGCVSQDEVAEVLDLAGRCTAVDPSDRPSMGQIVKALKGIEKRGMKMLLSV